MRRSLLIASLGLVAGVGCHAAPQRNPARIEAPVIRTDPTATRFITKHNQNVAAIRSLEAAPSIVIIGDHGEKKRGRANGHLALERTTKNFRLEIEAGLKHELADIGSNERGFWFWVDDDKERSIFVCDHKDINACQLGVTLQPDWIMEAMGLRAFTAEEARTLSTTPGETPGTVVLTQTRRDAKNQRYTKETIISEQTGEIREHRLWAGVKQELLASATISNYKEVRFVDTSPRRDDEPTDVGAETVVTLPERFRLNWVKENLAIEVAMSGLKINPTFPQERRVVLFSEPKIPGMTRRDLAQLDPEASAASSRVYESRPIPEAGGIRLKHPEPSPMNGEDVERRAIDPAPFSADLSATSAQPIGVVGAPIPSADKGILRTSTTSRWRSPSLAH